MQKKIKDLLAVSPLEIEGMSGNPGTLRNGMLWYDSTAGALKARINGATVALGAGGGGGGGNAQTADPLSQFAATTSSQLAGVISDETGTGALVFANSPTLVTPALGTPSAITLTNATGLPVSTGISGFGTGVATFLATPSSANLRSAVADGTGTGALFFAGGNFDSATGTSIATTDAISTETVFSSGTNATSGSLFLFSGIGGGAGVELTSVNATAYRAIAFPDADGTLVLENNAQTLTNKTISGSSNTITNVSLTAGVTGTLPVASGGTGATTLSGLVHGNGTAAMTAVTTNAALYAAVTDLYVDHTVAIMDEDFLGGTNTDGQAGTHGVRYGSISGSNSIVFISGTVDNPGQLQLASGASSGNAGSLFFGGSSLTSYMLGANHFEIRITFKLNQTTATKFRLGLANDYAAVTPGRGEYLRYDTSLGDTNFMYVVKDGGAETATSTGIAADTNWHTLRIRTITPGSYIYGMSMNTSGGAFGSETQVTNTNSVGGITRYIVGIIGNDAVAASKSFILDAVKMRWKCTR